MTINASADEMVMDRTTLGRNILPLERDGVISIKPGRTYRRSKELRLTDTGLERLRAGYQGWKDAQRELRPPSAMSEQLDCAPFRTRLRRPSLLTEASAAG